jgi:hypothetical protein
MDRVTVQQCARSTHGGKEFIGRGIIDGRYNRLVRFDECN